MGLTNEYLRPLLQKLSLKSLHNRVEAIADPPIAAKNSDDFKGNMDQPDLTPKVSESRPLPPNKVRVRSEKAKTLNGGLQKASKKKEEKLAAASLILVQESRTRIAATPNARTSSGSSLSRLISTDNKGWNRADGSGTDEVDDGAVWREKILMGKRCKPLKVGGGGKNSVLVEAAASEVGNGMKAGPAAMTVAEERNRIVVSLERKCLDEDYPFPSREELDTDPYVLGWLYIADICDYNTSSDSSMAGSATGGDSTAQSDSGKVLWSTKRRRSLSVMISRYLRR